MRLFKKYLANLFVTTGLLFFCSNIVAQQYKIILDEDLSPYAGASALGSTYNFYKYLDDRLVPSSAGKTGFGWGVARIGHLSVDYVISSYFMVFQHEVFGHGYRAREFDFSHIGYKINIASGATYFLYTDYYKLSIYQENALNAAGIEANTIFSQEIRQSFFADNKIDHRAATAYFLNQIEQLRYVYTTYDDANYFYRDGNDINNYIVGVNNYYGNRSTLSNSKMRAYILTDLLDPTLYVSLYCLWEYIIRGTPQVDLLMFNINDYKYLPTARTILAPYGLEFQLQNFIKTPQQQLIQFNLRYGSNSNINTVGIDLNVTPIWRYKKFVFSNNLSLWRQPEMVYANAAVAHQKFGGADFVRVEYNASKKFSLLLDVGYKTMGFMQGFQLGNNYIIRAGCKW